MRNIAVVPECYVRSAVPVPVGVALASRHLQGSRGGGSVHDDDWGALTRDRLAELTTSPDVEIRRRVVQHPATPAEAVVLLSSDQDLQICIDAYKHSNMPGSNLTAAVECQPPAAGRRGRQSGHAFRGSGTSRRRCPPRCPPACCGEPGDLSGGLEPTRERHLPVRAVRDCPQRQHGSGHTRPARR